MSWPLVTAHGIRKVTPPTGPVSRTGHSTDAGAPLGTSYGTPHASSTSKQSTSSSDQAAEASNPDGTTEVTISSDIRGASIAYALEEGEDAHWKLYVSPFTVPAGTAVRTRATRYGWTESEEVSIQTPLTPSAVP